MLKLTLENLWAHRLRLALTGVAVVLGVAFMTGTMVLTDTMGRTFDDMFEKANSGVDVVVQAPGSVATDQGEARARVPASTVGRVESVAGVEAAAGSISGFTQLIRADGSATPLDGLGSPVGTNWVTDEGLNPFELAAGRPPRAEREVVLDRATVDAEGWELGDQVTVMAGGEPVGLTLVGVATFGSLDGVPGSPLVAVSDPAAQRWFSQPGWYDSVVVAADEGVEPAELATEVDRALGTGSFEVLTGAEDTAEKQGELQEDLSFFSTFLMSFAFVSLFVGTFIIYNTFSILAAQRSKESAMLRTIGASRRQLLWSTTAESAVVGLVAGSVGLLVGIGGSLGLKALIGAVGLEIPSGPTVISTGTVVTAFVVGVVGTVVSAVGPAVRASRVRPIAALRDVGVARATASTARSAVGVAMTATGAAAFAAGVVHEGDAAPALLAVGAVVTVLGFFVLGPVVARPMIQVLGLPLSWWGGSTGRLARENAVRSPKRSAATASALMVGVALVGFITILATSTKLSIDDAIDRSMHADFLVESGALGEGGFSPSLADRLAALPEVESVSSYRSAPAEVDGTPVTIDSVDTATLDELFDLHLSAGEIADVVTGAIALSEDRASEHGLEIGDTIRVGFPGSEVDLEIAALYDSKFPEGGYLVDNSTLEAHVADRYDKKIFLSIDDGVDLEQARAALQEELATQPSAQLQDQTTFKESITSGVDSLLTLVYGLLSLAVVIALIGIANTLALSIHERRREIGLLRAVGMTRGQVRRAIRIESVLIALLGTTLGMLLAVASAWGIVKALEPDVSTFAVPYVQLVVIACLAASAGVLAALGPARRASKLDVLDAISAP